MLVATLCVLLLLPFVNGHHPDQSENFEHLPDWFHESDVGVVIPLGPISETDDAIAFWAFGSASSAECSKTVGAGFTLLHCSGPDTGDTINIKSELTATTYPFSRLTFPKPNCAHNTAGRVKLSYAVTIVKVNDTEMTTKLPYSSVHRLYCLDRQKNNGDTGRVRIKDNWRPEDEVAGCLILGLTETHFICHEASGQDCSVHVEKNPEGEGVLYIVLKGEGIVGVTTYNRMETLRCSEECEMKVGDANEVRVHCPSGEEHILHAEQDLTALCPFSQYRYIGNLAGHICRSTYLPSLFWALLIWILLGKFVLLATSYAIVALLSILSTIIRRRKIQCDLEKGICLHCGELICGDSIVSKHLSCSSGKCPYCDKKVNTVNLKTHCPTCPKKEKLTAMVIEGELRSFRSLTRISTIERYFLSVRINSGLYYIVIIMLLLVLMSPAGAEEGTRGTVRFNIARRNLAENTTKAESSTITEEPVTQGKEKFVGFDGGMDMDECYNADGKLEFCAAMSEKLSPIETIKHTHVGVFSQFEQEANYCGTSCWNDETECRCPKEGAEEFFSDQRYQGEQKDLERHKRDLVASEQLEEHAPSMLTGLFNRKKKRPIRIGKKVIVKALIKDALGSKGVTEAEKTFKPVISERVLELSWNSYQKTKDKILVKGYSTGELDAKEHEGLIWKITSPESSETKTLTVGLRDIAQVYVMDSRYLTTDRTIQSHMRATCTGNCPDHCGLDIKEGLERMQYEQEFPESRHWTCNPTWCWSIRAGCTCCTAYVTPELNDWMVHVFDVRYLHTKVQVCVQISNKKVTCKTLTDTGKIELPNVKISLSKIYGIDDKLPQKIAYVFYKKTNFGVPDYIWVEPDTCDSNCNHGHPGDYKCNSELHSPKDCSMTWKGIQTTYTCHSGDWPTCNFHSLMKKNTEGFKHINRTTEHLSDNYILKSMGDNMMILPKTGGGMMQFAITVNGLELQRKEIKPEVSVFKVSECYGCYGCSSGFECHVHIVGTKGMVFHIFAKDGRVLTNKQSFESGEGILKGYTLLNVSEAEFCLEELPEKCSAAKNLSLTRVDKILVEKDEVTTNVITDKDDCEGIKFFSCMFSTSGNFFSGIWEMVKGIFGNWKEILMIIAFSVVAIFLAYTFFLCCRSGRSKRNTIVNPAVLLKEVKVKEKATAEDLKQKQN